MSYSNNKANQLMQEAAAVRALELEIVELQQRIKDIKKYGLTDEFAEDWSIINE